MNHFVCKFFFLICFAFEYDYQCRNMSKSLTFWYSNFIPRFETIKSDSLSFEITRIGAR